jgi:hypothetical protein
MLPDTSNQTVELARIHLVFTNILLAIVIFIFVLRIYLKTRGSWRLNLGDYTMLVGVVSSLAVTMPFYLLLNDFTDTEKTRF